MSRLLRQRRAVLAASAGCALLVAGVALASPLTGSGFQLNPSAITGGGGTSSSAGYSVSGTIGQPVVATSSGSGYTVGAGLFAAMEAGDPTYRITAPGLAANP